MREARNNHENWTRELMKTFFPPATERGNAAGEGRGIALENANNVDTEADNE